MRTPKLSKLAENLYMTEDGLIKVCKSDCYYIYGNTGSANHGWQHVGSEATMREVRDFLVRSYDRMEYLPEKGAVDIGKLFIPSVVAVLDVSAWYVMDAKNNPSYSSYGRMLARCADDIYADDSYETCAECHGSCSVPHVHDQFCDDDCDDCDDYEEEECEACDGVGEVENE